MNHLPTPGAPSPLPHLLKALRALLPPQRLVHVGVGQGSGDLASWRQWPEVPAAILVDADHHRMAWASCDNPGRWQVLHATLADTTGLRPYHRASNPQEDGLVSPEQLKPWWPQLTTLGTDTRLAQTLDELMGMDGDAAPVTYTRVPSTLGHWLLLDCLPAAQLLRGASALLAHTSVVCARTSQAPTDSAAPLADTGHQALIDLLAPQGFVLLGQTETHHPALGYTIMARQPGALLAQAAAQFPAELPSDLPAEITEPTAPAHSDLLAENDALHQRLALLQEELLRAEGQISVIKDLMLRDQEL